MLVAFEGGSIIRAFMLLLSYPFLLAMNHEIRLRVMVFITFCGLKLKYMDSVGRAVLPKFYLENLNLQAYEVLASTRRKVLNYRIMEGMYFISFVDGPGLLVKHKALKEFFGDDKPDIGLGSSNSVHDHLFISLCKTREVVQAIDTQTMPVVVDTTVLIPEATQDEVLEQGAANRVTHISAALVTAVVGQSIAFIL
ncbi:hypothetical protein IFM89_020768 [Coptis chinensis]|uniref:Glycerol-3-phosphate acyltransferase RAM2/GPAT1-8 HAD-like domain-containing protein n=1 Tax=Coptis chinensis TaxID=261450 RepID=A0A835MIQ8_9MAGN|nr:hypothetical protein IFM89_020768 [Coptis chinensis]